MSKLAEGPWPQRHRPTPEAIAAAGALISAKLAAYAEAARQRIAAIADDDEGETEQFTAPA